MLSGMAEDIDYTIGGATWEGGHLRIDNPDNVRKVRRKLLSASVASKTLQCPASMAASRLLPQPPDPFSPREIGTSVHSVLLDGLYERPAAERTIDTARELLKEATIKQWGTEETPDSVKWVRTMWPLVEGIFRTENPAQVDVYATEKKIITDLATSIGGDHTAGVPSICIVDRIDRNSDGTLRVVDVKTGDYKAPNPRYGDNYGDQVRLYKDAVELGLGEHVSNGTLIFPKDARTRDIDFSEDAMRTTRTMFRSAWDLMNKSADRAKFETRPGNLCGWCPLANSCPNAKITTEKAQAAAATQPTATQLGIPTVRVGAAPANQPEPAVQATPDPFPVTVTETPAETVPVPRMRTSDTQAQQPRAAENGEDAMSDTDQTSPAVRGEAPSYEEDAGGQLNLNSYAAMAVSGLVSEAVDHLEQHQQPIRPESISKLADVFAGIVLRAQLQISGQANFQRGANTRLRGLLRTIIAHRPAPFGQDANAWAQWMNSIQRFLVVALSEAIALHERTPVQNDSHLYFATQATPATNNQQGNQS